MVNMRVGEPDKVVQKDSFFDEICCIHLQDMDPGFLRQFDEDPDEGRGADEARRDVARLLVHLDDDGGDVLHLAHLGLGDPTLRVAEREALVRVDVARVGQGLGLGLVARRSRGHGCGRHGGRHGRSHGRRHQHTHG